MGISPIRLTVIQILVLSLLVTLLGRLWYIQVLAGGEAREQAERASIKFVYERAPRGFIFDRSGRTLARNRTALTVALDVSAVPADRKDGVIKDLADVLDMDAGEVREIFDDKRIGPHTPRPIALDVPEDTVIFLNEHADRFPGVTDLEIPVREYPMGPLAAHVVGHIGEVNAEELESLQERSESTDGDAPATREYRAGDLIGKFGVERIYEDWLAGRAGTRKIAVDVNGEAVQEFDEELPERGLDAILTIDAGLQLAAEDALDRGLALAQDLVDPDTGKRFNAPAGAVVALDPRNGEVLALASSPDFDPNVFIGSARRKEISALNAPDANMPFLNRAVAEAVPPGSTFKPITALAAWEEDEELPTRTFQCPGYYKVENRTFRDWTPEGHGAVGLSRSLAESCDIVYYTLGDELDGRDRDAARRSASGDLKNKLSDVARTFGFGKETGIDLLSDREGLVPDALWKFNRFSYAQTYDRRWFTGDTVNLAIGQGFLQVTPLQLAVAYAAIANGGTLYRPHVLKCLGQLDVSRPVVVDRACRGGTHPESASPKVTGRVEASPSQLRFLEEGMAGTVVGEGTAADAFSDFPRDRVFVAGKSGTAQMAPRQPFAWFAAIARSQGKEIVAVALIEEGGSGSQTAAPIVRRMIEQHFDLPQGDFEAGVATD